MKKIIKYWKGLSIMDRFLVSIAVVLLLLFITALYFGTFYQFTTQHTVEQFIDGSSRVIE